MIGKKLKVAKGKEMDWVAGGGGYSWKVGWGQEIIQREIISRTKPGDRVLDLGGGEGRVSLPLAARGARVTIVDNCGDNIEYGEEQREKAGFNLKVKTVVADVRGLRKKDVGGGVKVILASDVVNHMTKADADMFIDGLPRLLNCRQGGMIYVDAPSTESGVFQYPEYHGATRVDERTCKVTCICTGEPKKELMPFFDSGEIEARLARQGASIVSANTFSRGGNTELHEVVAKFGPRKK